MTLLFQMCVLRLQIFKVRRHHRRLNAAHVGMMKVGISVSRLRNDSVVSQHNLALLYDMIRWVCCFCFLFSFTDKQIFVMYADVICRRVGTTGPWPFSATEITKQANVFCQGFYVCDKLYSYSILKVLLTD